MNTLPELLVQVIRRQSKSFKVAVKLSAGIDSLTVARCLLDAGKKVHAYTFQLDSRAYLSDECTRAVAIARHLSCPITIVNIPLKAAENAAFRCIVQYRASKKTQAETLFPWLFVYPHIRQEEIWSGWNADDHYANTREAILEFAKLRAAGASTQELKLRFDGWRAERYRKFDSTDSADTWWLVQRLAVEHGKRLLDPYTAPEIREFFQQYDHEQLSSPSKPLIRAAFKDALADLPASIIAKGKKLQIGGHINDLFGSLL